MIRRRGAQSRAALVGAAIAGMALAGTALAGACGGGDRDFGRADTAALLSDSLAALVAESARAAGDPTRSDSAITDSIRMAFGGDTLGIDAAGAVARVVLRADSAAGDVLYHGRGGCLTCHALNGAGVAGIAPSLRDSVWLHGDGDPAMVERIVRDGVAQPKSVANRMPGFAAMLSDAEIRRIAAYVFAISHAGGTVVDTAAAGAPADTLDREGSSEP